MAVRTSNMRPPVAGASPYSAQDIRNHAVGSGWADSSGNILNPQAIYGAAQQYGVTADQLDQAGGWAGGTASNWIQQQGLNPLSGQAAAPPAPPNPYLEPQGTIASMGGVARGAPGAATGGAPQGYGYTGGPAGSSGGLAGGMIGTAGNSPANPYLSSLSSGGGSQAPQNPYGYGQAPSSGGLGYYEQQTPVGSFAAANQQYSQGQQRTPQQFAGTSLASNPYIDQTTGGISGPGAVSGQFGSYSNPYLGGSSGQIAAPGSNPYAGSNPHLSQAVGDSLGLAADSFRDTVLPQFDRMDRQSGSFGNTGVAAARNRAIDAFGRSQSQAATQAYMQDYGMQQGLAENALNRGMQADMFNVGARGTDLTRNLSGGFAQAGMNNHLGMQGAMFDAGNQMQTQQFNAGLRQGDLGRQTNAALGLGTFNAGQSNQMGQFNAGQGNQLGQFWAQLGQGNNQFNAGQGNAINLQNTGWANSMLENSRNRTQQQGQFDANLDWNIDRDNWGRERTGTQDQLSLLGMLSAMGQQGINNAGVIQNTPLNYWQQLSQTGQGLAGLGGSTSQLMQGNPLLGAIAGWQLGSGYFGG